MSKLVSTLTGVIVGWGLSCLTRAFSYDALARQTCSSHLIELNEHLQSLAKQLQITTRKPVDDHRALVEIENCLNKLRIASFGLRIQNQILKNSISSSFNSLLRYLKIGEYSLALIIILIIMSFCIFKIFFKRKIN